MEIVQIATELAPLAKVGGLGDVVYGLSKALISLGHRVWVFLPKYDCIDLSPLPHLSPFGKKVMIKKSGQVLESTFWHGVYEGIDLLLIDPSDPENSFERGHIYGQADDPERFCLFTSLCAEALKEIKADVIHLHDWPASSLFFFPLPDAKKILTIHNLEHQGIFPLDLPSKFHSQVDPIPFFMPPSSDVGNLLKGGIELADQITTVSPTYKEEILTKEMGFGLDPILQQHTKKLSGILNGIDIEFWDPDKDPFLAHTYTPSNIKEGKELNRKKVSTLLNLPYKEGTPLFIAITRLADQKAPDLILHGITKILEMGGQFALLGSTLDLELQKQFLALDAQEDVAICLKHQEKLAHLLYASGSFLLMPSIFEPCGLSQLIAMRYGTIPLVRTTGGLKDTVVDEKTGLTFDIPDNRGIEKLIDRAFALYRSDEFPKMQLEGMKANFSWEVPAQEYVKIYKK